MADKKIVDLTRSQTIADSDYVFVNQSGEPVWVPASKVKSYAIGDIAGGTTDYTSLTNKPQIGGVELVGNKTLDQLGIQPKIAEVLEEEIVIENPVKTAKVVAEQEVVAPKVSANQVEAGNLYKKTEIDTMVDAKIDKNQGSGNSGKYLRVGSDGNVELVNAPSSGGGGTGTSDYNDLTNKPQINGVSLSGNKTLDQLGIQAKGNYLTSIPDVYVTESELGTKVDKNQGTLNSGKYLAVGTDGNVELVDAPSGGEGGTSNYNSLTNRPQINGVTLTGNKTAADLNLQAAGNYLTSVPKATSAVYGGIKAATATASDTVPVRIKSDGTLAVATYPVLATATSTALGGIKADAKTSSDTVPVRIDASTGKLYVQTYPTSGGDGSGYVLPQATSTELGGVKATLATSAYTDEVRINSNGNLVVQAYALKASPTFTGTPKAPTASSTTNNTQIATTAFVHSLTDNKLDKNQGSTNSGKYLAVGSDGNIQYVSAPSGGGGSGTNDYESLLNRPSINGVELTGNKSLGDLGISIVPSGGSTGQVLKKTSNANGDYAWADESGGSGTGGGSSGGGEWKSLTINCGDGAVQWTEDIDEADEITIEATGVMGEPGVSDAGTWYFQINGQNMIRMSLQPSTGSDNAYQRAYAFFDGETWNVFRSQSSVNPNSTIYEYVETPQKTEALNSAAISVGVMSSDSAHFIGSGTVVIRYRKSSGGGSGGGAQEPRVQMQSTDTSATIEPGKLYVWPEMSNLSVSFATPSNAGVANEYHFFFKSGATPTTFSMTGVTADAYSIDANTTYEVSVLEGIAYVRGTADA